ncbi:MAG: DUF4384 domain-containing protein [Desulfobacteraceae bacterium]|nr:DUF4384 domain-containing protein [Desulfobacteraceae bacterium]
MEPSTLQVFGIITAQTVPVVLDFLVKRLKMVLKSKKGKGKGEVEALKEEIENLKAQLESKDIIEVNQIKQVEAQLEKARLIQQQYGLELISDRAHKLWILEQFEELGRLKSSQSTFNIDIWTQEGISSAPRDVTIVPKTTPSSYRIGDRITFFFCSNRDCYLTLFNLGTSGSVTILFPNKLFRDNLIMANRIYSIPGEGYSFEYKLSGPAGVEIIKAIATMDKVDLVGLDFSKKGIVFHSAERSAAAKDIQIVEKRVKELPATGWATAMCEFAVR